MPLIDIDVIRGRDAAATRVLLDAVHDAMVEAFETPSTDRYQVLTQHDEHELVVEDTGLGFPRSLDLVVLRVTSRARSDEKKQEFYRLLATYLEDRAGVSPDDVVVSIVENGPADWSFGGGVAQFLTGDLD